MINSHYFHLKLLLRLNIFMLGIETRDVYKRQGLNKVHPHKFRRTLATMAIDKGMPIEQLQQLLGHRRIAVSYTHLDVYKRQAQFIP